MRIQAVAGALPLGFDALRTEARDEGHRMMDRLAAQWDDGVRFDRDGEALLAAWLGTTLAGIGGITQDPALPGALRMRRFYVRPAHRRGGLGRALADAVLRRVRGEGRAVLVNAGTPDAAAFWHAVGFVPEAGGTHTHRLPATPGRVPARAGR